MFCILSRGCFSFETFRTKTGVAVIFRAFGKVLTNLAVLGGYQKLSNYDVSVKKEAELQLLIRIIDLSLSYLV